MFIHIVYLYMAIYSVVFITQHIKPELKNDTVENDVRKI